MQNLIFRLLTWEISVMLVSTFTCPRGVHNSLLPDPEDCASYFHCISGGRYYHKTCSFGLRFDNRHKICSWASLVHCNTANTQDKLMPADNRNESEKYNFQDPFQVKTYMLLSDIGIQKSFKKALLDKRFGKDEVEGSGDIGAETFVDKNVGIMNKRKTKDTSLIRPTVKCVNAFSFLTDPLRCDVFYQCHMWIPYPKLCPKGLYFDDSSFVCNWPHAVNCANGHRKPLFVQVPIDEKANKIPTIQNTHDKKAAQDKTGKRSHIGVFLSSTRSKTDVESKSAKALNQRKATQDDNFHSTNFISGRNLPNRHNPFAPIMTTPPFSKREQQQQEISTSGRSVNTTIKDTLTSHDFSGEISSDTNLTEKGDSTIRKTIVKKNEKIDSKVTASHYRPIVFSTIRMDRSVYLQRIDQNQSKENQTNKISETETVRANSELRKSLLDTGHSNGSNVTNASKDISKSQVENKLMDEISESKEDFLRNSDEQRIDDIKYNANQSTTNEPIILSSSTIVNNSIPEKEKYTQIKIDKEEYTNGSNSNGNGEQMTMNNDELSSAIKNFSRFHNFTVGTDINKNDSSVNSFEDTPLVKEMLLTMSSEGITDKTPIIRILPDLFHTNNTNQSNLKSLNTEEPTTKSYLLVNEYESKIYTETTEKPSIVPGFDNSSYNLLTNKSPANISASHNKLLNIETANGTNTDKETIRQERLNQPFDVLDGEQEPTESINVFKDPKASLFAPTNHSMQDSNSEVVRDYEQENVSVLPFPQKHIQHSNKIDHFINQNRNDNLNRTSKTPTFTDRNSNLGLLRSIKALSNKTKNEKSGSNLGVKDFTIDSIRTKNQEKRIDTQDKNSSGPRKNTRPSWNIDEQRNGVQESNRTYIEYEMSSLMTSSVKSKNVNLMTKILKTQHGKHLVEQKPSNESINVTIQTNVHNITMENPNTEHVECSNVMITGEDSTSTAVVKVGNATDSEIKTTKTINETEYKNVVLPRFSFQKNKIKNHEPIKISLHRKLVELFNNFLPGPENTATLLKRIKKMRDKLLKEKNESVFGSKGNNISATNSTSSILERNLQKDNVTVQTTRPQYVGSNNKSIETTSRYEISSSEIVQSVKEKSDRTDINLRNGNKIVAKESILRDENSSNNIKGFSESDKIGDFVTRNTSPAFQGVSHEFSRPIINSKQIQRGDALLNPNSSVEIEFANGSVVPQNLNQNIKRNLNHELLTNIHVTTNSVTLEKNITLSKANRTDNIRPDVNTKHSKNMINEMFYDMMSLGNRMSTLNSLIVDTVQKDETYNQSYQKRDFEKLEITDSNGTYINISNYGITEGVEEIIRDQSQNIASNVSKDQSSRKMKEIDLVVGNAPKRDERLKNVTSKGSDHLNISVNTTESGLGRSRKVSYKSNETTFSGPSKDLPDQKQMSSRQQIHLSLEPEEMIVTQEEFIEA